MTMDDDPEHFSPTPPRKSYNPFECDDEAFDTLGTQSVNVCAKQDHIGFDLTEFEESAKSLSFLMDNDDALWEESVSSTNDHTSSFEKDVTECELHEPIVSKDIGIDEGARAIESKDSSKLQLLSGSGDDSMSKDKVGCEKDVLEAPKPMLSDEWRKDSVLYPDEDPCVDGLNRDVLESYKSADQKPGIESQVSFSFDSATMDGASEKAEAGSFGRSGADQEEMSAKKDNDNDNSPNKAETISAQGPAMEETQQETKDNPDEAEAEEQTLPNPDNNMSIDLNSSSTTHSDPINQEANPQSAEPARSTIAPQATTRHEQPTSLSSDPTAVPHYPSSITFSGPVAFSGNASIRSESSTGSTRSFAFPVLQNEWNSSPVRMAKADRKRREKNKRWMKSLVCCRF